MANNASNVSTGKPKVGGAIFVAPKGTTLPTDATTALNPAFTCLGYCSEDGVTNSNSVESSTVKAWGGDVVLSMQTGKSDSFKFKLIEVLNLDVLKFVYGDDNVIGTDLATGITIKSNGSEAEEKALVVDMVMRDDNLKRIVIPAGKLSSLGDIVYKASDLVGYDVTISAAPDSSDNTHYEYIQTPGD
ncbi:MAG: phage tail protein [Lachnospiraceae bacterium]|nr:phage tail protein [Lachnospiraceae bacterium]